MKKVLPFAVAALLAGCNSSSTEVTDTDTIVAVLPATDPTIVYTPVDGDIIYKDGKTMVMKDGQWVEVSDTITLENGVVIDKTGKATKDGIVIRLDEGEVVTKTGNFFDKTGKAIDNAWQDTKEAVKDAGKAVGDAAKKVGKEIDTAFSDKK